jgi:hypothetical protein
VTARLPFTLTPLDGEPFEVWLHAYAARLAMAPDQLADVLGLPSRRGHGTITRPSAAQLAVICAATGLDPSAVTALFTPCEPVPPPRLLQAWMPQRTTRFCPGCLAEDPGQMPAAWSLPVTFFCLRHGQLLASCCPQCGRQPASLAGPSRAGRCIGRDGCGGVLGTTRPHARADVPAARQTQEAISGFVAGIRDPAGTGASRRQALGQLTDLTITAFHVAAGDPRRRPVRSVTLLGTDTLTTAFTLLMVRPDSRGGDPLASLVAPVPPDAVPPAVPLSWHGPARRCAPGSPAPAMRGCGLLTGCGMRPPCPSRGCPSRARPGRLTRPPSARPGCPTRSGRTGRSASATTAPHVTTSCCPRRWSHCCSRTATCRCTRSLP